MSFHKKLACLSTKSFETSSPVFQAVDTLKESPCHIGREIFRSRRRLRPISKRRRGLCPTPNQYLC